MRIGRGAGGWWGIVGACIAFGCSGRDAPTGTIPVVTSPAPFLVAGAASVEQMVYVSLPPAAIPTGLVATIRDSRTGSTATAPIVDGGFDPVPLPATAGDRVSIVVQTSLPDSSMTFGFTVPAENPPVVVRTDPPPHKRDVPLNANLVIVFSEPIATNTLTNATIHLTAGGSSVEGQLGFINTAHTIASFTPTGPLAANTDYQLVVSTGVRDLSGEAVAAPVSVPFTTGLATQSLTVAPDHVTLLFDGSFGPPPTPLVATLKNGAGDVIAWQAGQWLDSDPSTVGLYDPAHGMSPTIYVYPHWLGTTVITATSAGVSGNATVTVVAPPGTYVAPLPAVDTLTVGAAVRLNARFRNDHFTNALGQQSSFDVGFGLAPNGAVMWTSSNPAVASVDSTGTVVGVSLGTSTINANYNGVVGSATVSVVAAISSTVGSFVTAGPMNVARAWGTVATLLNDGTVLVAGGGGGAEIYDPATRRFVLTGPPVDENDIQLATLLRDGRVLLVGVVGAQLYDPGTRTFAATGSPNAAQSYDISVLPLGASLLPDGRVLVLNGVTDWEQNNPPEIRAVLYDPSTGVFTRAGPYAQPAGAWGPTVLGATLLKNGTVLMEGDPYSELYDPVSNTFSIVGAMTYSGTAAPTLLPNGTVLLTGANGELDQAPISGAELYDPLTKAFTATGSLISAREGHTATLMSNGRVLVVGGDTPDCPVCGSSSTATAEVYDPASGAFASAGRMSTARSFHASVALRDGSVLVLGGVIFTGNNAPGWKESPWLNSAELFIPNQSIQAKRAKGHP